MPFDSTSSVRHRPCRGRGGIFPRLLDEIAVVRGLDYEILVVDDGSIDATWQLLTARAARDPRVRPCAMRSAPARARRSGRLRRCRAAPGWRRWTATARTIPPMCRACLRERSRATSASSPESVRRGMTTGSSGSPPGRQFGRSALLGDGTPDTGCGLKVIRRSAFLALPYFDHMHRFLPALVQAQGGRCVSVPVNHRPRVAGKSHYGSTIGCGSGWWTCWGSSGSPPLAPAGADP